MSRPKDQQSQASASATTVAATGTGSRPEAATTSTMPWVAATTLRDIRCGSAPRSQGSANEAATKAYRNAPIASTHAPSGRSARRPT